MPCFCVRHEQIMAKNEERQQAITAYSIAHVHSSMYGLTDTRIHRYTNTRTSYRKGHWKIHDANSHFSLHRIVVMVAVAVAGRPCSRLIGFHLNNKNNNSSNGKTIAIIKTTKRTRETLPPTMAIVMQF